MEKPEETSFEKAKRIWVTLFSFVFFAAVSVNFIEIIMRVVFNASVDLLYDIPAWFNTWAMLLVSGVILIDNEHLSIDAIRSKITGKKAKVLDAVNNLLTIIFGGVVTYSGIVFVKQQFTFGTVYTRIITIPSWIVELCVPLGMGLFTVFAVIKFIRDIRRTYQDNA